MSKETIRVVIRQPLHGLIKEWADVLGVSDFGEVVNYLLLDLKRGGHLLTPQSTPNSPTINPQHLHETTTTKTISNADDDIAGLFDGL
jgi:hypothetical protein